MGGFAMVTHLAIFKRILILVMHPQLEHPFLD